MNQNFRRAGLATFRGDGFEPVNTTGAEDEFGTFGRESAGGGGANPAGGAGDENPFFKKSRWHGWRMTTGAGIATKRDAAACP